MWTGDAGVSQTYLNFTGTIWTTGVFDSLTPGCGGNICPLESGDVVNAAQSVTGGDVITFDTVATDGLDGFDFTATAQPVYFDLRIDGQAIASLVFFTSGGQLSSPPSLPFGLTTQ